MERLLDMISDTTRQLNAAQQTQRDLLASMAEVKAARDTANERCDDLEAHLKQETEAKEYLTVELNKAEGTLVCLRISTISLRRWCALARQCFHVMAAVHVWVFWLQVWCRATIRKSRNWNKPSRPWKRDRYVDHAKPGTVTDACAVPSRRVGG